MVKQVIAVFAVALFAVAASAAPTYVFSTIDVPASRQTQALGVNNLGQIVGIYQPQDGSAYRGFLYAGGGFQDLVVPQSYYTQPNAINDRGEIVGTFLTDNPAGGTYFRPFVYSAAAGFSVMPDLPVTGFQRQSPLGINNRGEIVGDFVATGDPDGHTDGYIYRNGAYEIFPNIWATDLTDDGLISGTRAVYEGVVFETLADIDAFRVGDRNTLARAIASDGSVAGTSFDALGYETGFVRAPDGSISGISYGAGLRTSIVGMNDAHTLVGYYYDPSSPYLRTRGFIGELQVVPEPSTLALVGVSGLLLLAFRHRVRGARLTRTA